MVPTPFCTARAQTNQHTHAGEQRQLWPGGSHQPSSSAQLCAALLSHSKHWKDQYFGKPINPLRHTTHTEQMIFNIRKKLNILSSQEQALSVYYLSISRGYQHILIHSCAFPESEDWRYCHPHNSDTLSVPGTSSSQTALVLEDAIIPKEPSTRIPVWHGEIWRQRAQQETSVNSSATLR